MSGKPGREIRAEIDAENARGLVIANGGASVALVAFLPQVLDKAQFDPLTHSIFTALWVFVIGLASCFLYNRLRRKCSLEWEAHGMMPPSCSFFGRDLGEPCVCLWSTAFMWAAGICFVIGAGMVILGGQEYLGQRLHQPNSTAVADGESYYVALTAWGTWALVGVTFLVALGTIRMMKRQADDARNALQVQLLLQLNDRFEGEALSQSRSDVAHSIKIGAAFDDFHTQSLLDFFETIGYLTRIGSLDPNMVYNEYSVALTAYWTALRPYMTAAEAAYHSGDMWSNAKWLAESHMRRDGVDAVSSETIAAFIGPEIKKK